MQALRAALRTGQGRGEHRRRAREVRRGAQDPQGRGDHRLRLRRHRHAERPLPQPRRPRRRVPGQPGAGRPRVDARHGAEQPRPEEVRLQLRHEDAPGRSHRAQAGHERALRPDHGDRVPPGDGEGGADDAGAGDRVDEGGPEALRGSRRHHRPRRSEPPGAAADDEARRRGRGQRHRRDRLPLHHGRRQRPRGDAGVDVGHLQQAVQDRGRQDHDRRLAPGPDRPLHDTVPDRRPRRREELERRADVPAGRRQPGGQEGLRPRGSRSTSTPTATARSTPS